jgi:hypothetical protein
MIDRWGFGHQLTGGEKARFVTWLRVMADMISRDNVDVAQLQVSTRNEVINKETPHLYAALGPHKYYELFMTLKFKGDRNGPQTNSPETDTPPEGIEAPRETPAT